MKVESSKQIRSQTCCSVTIDSKNHLVAAAVSTDDYPVIQEDAHRRLSKQEQQALDLASEEDRDTARTIVSRLHVELGHSDPRGMIDSLRRKHAHRLIIAESSVTMHVKSETKITSSGCSNSSRTWHMSSSQVEASSVEPARVGNHHGGRWKSCCLRDHPQSHGHWAWIGQRDR